MAVVSLVLAQPVIAWPQQGSTVAPAYALDNAKLRRVVDWVKGDVASGRIPGAVVFVARDGKVLLQEAAGWADKDKQIPMAIDSIHPIASSTKLVTTVAVLRLIEQDKVRIFAPIANYLPELKNLKVQVEKRDAAGNVTTELVNPVRPPNVHDLMTHRAGFTYRIFPKNPVREKYKELDVDGFHTTDADEMLRRLATLPLVFQPGSQFEYSLATDLLGHIVERVTGKRLDAALKELVLDPLKMKDTAFFVAEGDMKRFARPFSNDPDMWVFEFIDTTKPPKRFSGGGGLVSTTADYFKLLQMMLNGGTLDGVRLLSPITVRWAMADHTANTRGVAHPGDCYAWNLFNPVRVCEGAPLFPGSIGDVFWGGITGPRYFIDPKERLVGMVFMQGPSQRAAYHAELRALVYGSFTDAKRR
jgi:CubicO group peptidase (beta-lactamase class C family)